MQPLTEEDVGKDKALGSQNLNPTGDQVKVVTWRTPYTVYIAPEDVVELRQAICEKSPFEVTVSYPG